ncbi:sensor histidine kinase [Clostridium arbusti]|uniref:sensor histidine kinase n=1 Tax=Clostridium arbusti TaxID=1137848 RepID=UPI0002F16FB5|nr:HAMP domain-containing sensor histidine kinase [Clostridium arbusti]
MSIRRKLTISYIAMLLIPIILFVVVTAFIGIIFRNRLGNVYNVGFEGAPIENIIQKDSKAIDNIKEYILKNKKNLSKDEFFSEQEKYLNKHTGIIVRKDEDLLYISPFLKNSFTYSLLPQFDRYDNSNRLDFLKQNKFVILKQYDFYMEDESKISIFLVLNTTSSERIFYEFIALEIGILIAILIITNGILTFLVSKSIVTPLEKLKDSAVLIKNGNLNFKLDSDESDEIGELSRVFEEMRFRLKESIDMQLQYENNRKELISNISHDLKTPVTAIKAYVEGIKDGIADTPEKMDRYINTIYVKTIDMDRLIEELFLFSKLDLKKIPFNFEKVELLDYLNDCIDELRFDLEKKNISITLTNELRDDAYVVGDREKLKRVIMNIVENSVKYMNKERGEIHIKVNRDKEWIFVSFKDNGMGISKRSLKYVFDRFYRADSSRNSNTGGSGLGLAISKKIIEEHGGEIWAESYENHGTNIIFTLKKWRDDYIEKDINS